MQWGRNIVFRDSRQFFTFFLDFLVKSLAKTGRQNFYLSHDTMQNIYSDATEKLIQLVEQKGVFCYDYIDRCERLDETALPPLETFYNRLTGEDCSEADDARGQQEFKNFKLQHIGDYMRLYF